MKLVFVSFLHSQHAQGQMVNKLKTLGYNPLVFKFHNSQPDLTKLDKMFGALSEEATALKDEIEEMETEIKTKGLQKVFNNIADKS